MVTLGDCIDRGPDSKGVIDLLQEIGQSVDLRHLRGNHEIMMLRARDDRQYLVSWLGVGDDIKIFGKCANKRRSPPKVEFAQILTYLSELRFVARLDDLNGTRKVFI